MRRTLGFAWTAALLAGAAAAGASAQEAPKSIKVGYVISLSGPQSAGAMLTTVPNYRLWVDEVNKAGGLMLKKYNKRVPIEASEIDDRSNNEDMVRLVERLMSVDKVDIVLSPWGTGPNLQAAPTFNKYGYPQIMGTAATDKIPELAPRFRNAFWLLGRPTEGVGALVDLLSDLKKKGQLKDTVALFTVQHPFGSEFLTPAKPALEKAGFKIVYETTYPLGVSDLRAQIKAAKAANPDTMIAFSYPPDTFMLTEQSLANDFNPKFKFLGVGVAFPSYKGKFGDKINGMFGLGAWDPKGPGVQGLLRAPQGREQGRRARPLGLLQHLRRLAGAAAGDRARRRDRPRQDHEGGQDRYVQDRPRRRQARWQPLTRLWWVGQWQGGEYKGIAPANLPGAVAPMF